MALPKLPLIPEKVLPRPHFAYVFFEPIVPKYSAAAFDLLTDYEKKRTMKELEESNYEKSLTHGNMRRGIVMALPADVDTKKFTMQVNDVVAVPYGEYHTINVDRTLIHMVGLYDLAIIPDLTEEECTKWNTDQERYRNEIMYPEPTTKDSKIIKFN